MSDDRPGTSLVPVSSSRKGVPAKPTSAAGSATGHVGKMSHLPEVHEGISLLPASLPITTAVDQSRSKVGGDQVAGHKFEGDLNQTFNVELPRPRKAGRIEALINRLREEMANKVEIQHTMESLSRFERRVAADEVVGLRAKLQTGGRASEYNFAINDKEDFTKLLVRMQRYGAAQEILGLILAEIDFKHRNIIEPRIGELNKTQINKLVEVEIIRPIIEQLDVTEFGMTHSMAMGMIYWLAERCYVKWH